jgi:hypothetical protein
MAKVTARLSVKGTDLREMMEQAKEQMADLGDAQWRITEVELWNQEDMASKSGMVRLWSGSFTLEANVE